MSMSLRIFQLTVLSASQSLSPGILNEAVQFAQLRLDMRLTDECCKFVALLLIIRAICLSLVTFPRFIIKSLCCGHHYRCDIGCISSSI